MLCSHQQDDSSGSASDDVDQARTRLQHLTLALQKKRRCGAVACSSIALIHARGRRWLKGLQPRREVADKLGRWREEQAARAAVPQPLPQAGQQPQEPEAPNWLRALREEYSQLQVCMATLLSCARLGKPATIALCQNSSSRRACTIVRAS